MSFFESYSPKEINYQMYLSKLIECEEKQDSSIEHEWVFSFKNDAIKVCNYLKNSGYKQAYWKEWKLLNITSYYVGVPFQSLKK